jgi:hypothetical protein
MMNGDTVPAHWQFLPPRQQQGDWGLFPFDSTLIVPGTVITDSLPQTELPAQPEFRFEGLRRIENNHDWLLVPLLLGILLITLSRALYFRRFFQVFSSVLSSNNMNIMLREGNVLGEILSILLFANYLLMSGLVLFLSVEWTGMQIMPARYPDYFLFAAIILGLILFIFFKVLMIQFTGAVFRTGQESGDYVLNTYLYNYIIGVLIMPLVVLAIYPGLEWALHASWALAALLYLARIVRGILIGIRNVKFSPILFLLYLCTLEILPLAFVIKLLIYKA